MRDRSLIKLKAVKPQLECFVPQQVIIYICHHLCIPLVCIRLTFINPHSNKSAPYNNTVFSMPSGIPISNALTPPFMKELGTQIVPKGNMMGRSLRVSKSSHPYCYSTWRCISTTLVVFFVFNIICIFYTKAP